MREINVAVVGGGVAGVTAALAIASFKKVRVSLFEKAQSPVSGPPFCHLHAGGNLYPDISLRQSITLLEQSIAFMRLFPFIVDYRPTLIALPKRCEYSLKQQLIKLQTLTRHYAELVRKDQNNKVLGEPQEYFKIYSQKEIKDIFQNVSSLSNEKYDKWLRSSLKILDLPSLQLPLVLVQEYGLNLFVMSALSKHILDTFANIQTFFQTQVISLKQEKEGFELTYETKERKYSSRFDYLVNAAGFQTGKIDDMLGAPCKRMVEFKAAYVARWRPPVSEPLPEIIIHGKRGSKRGMAQFTPYGDNLVQLHAMTPEATLYPDGLVTSSEASCQPKLKSSFIQKIEAGWSQEEVDSRTRNAIAHLGAYIPPFLEAEPGAKPLFGAQQIPGDDPSLRVAEVSFPLERYARCEIVKVSSAPDMALAIVKDMFKSGLLPRKSTVAIDTSWQSAIEPEQLFKQARIIAKQRGYPEAMAVPVVREAIG